MQPPAPAPQVPRSASLPTALWSTALGPLAARATTKPTTTKALAPVECSDVAWSGKHFPTQPLLPAFIGADFVLDLRLSTLRHGNTTFPRHNDVYTLACRVYISLSPFRMGNYSLRQTYDLVVGDQRLEQGDLALDIVTLFYPACQAPLLPAANLWIANALKG